MLRKLISDLPDFKSAEFAPGLNIAVAERTKKARQHDSRNAVGKTSFVRTLDFLLGSDARPDHILRRPELENASFSLEFDLLGEATLATRTGVNPGVVTVGDHELRINAWRQRLGEGLFHLDEYSFGPSYRSLISFYLRDVASGAFGSPTETHKKQSFFDTQPALAYLFNLDLSILSKVKEIIETEKSLANLKRAAKDPVLGMTLGRAQDLDAQIRTLRIQASALEKQIADFSVVERYAEHRARADELSRAIRKLNDQLVMTERQVGDIERSIEREDDAQPDHEYVQNMYEQVGIVLPQQVVRRFDEVAAFHESIVNNRRRYLEKEHAKLIDLLSRDRSSLAALDKERSQIMRLLESGGALETYNELQSQVAKLRGRVAELVERRDVVDRWENSNRHLQLRAAEMELQISTDLQDRRDQIDEIAQTYSSYAYRIYGSHRPASLTIEPTKTGYKFVPTIGGDRSEGVRSMALFCFDLTMAVTAYRAGRGPDFLVHDSHLYDGVEGRQVASALTLAAEVAEAEGMQYIATMNSDDLAKAHAEGLSTSYTEAAKFTDRYDNGGFFGIRFN